ncbi:MAG: esterase [Solirubrobacterales bacterium]|nr:esterase [Solirubrobacterales bacterium]
MAPSFDYDNRNHRPPTVVSRGLRRALPGVGRVAAQTPRYAAWWRERNLEALERSGPLWVVLGDSMSQGIGASSVECGWVPRVQVALADRGLPVRVLNLSFSGARVADVLERQLPALAACAQTPAVTSVLVGSNDLLRRALRRRLVERYEELLDRLPAGALVATTPGRGRLGVVAEHVAQHPQVVDVPLSFAPGEVAEDRFHPDDAAYARLARTFTQPIAGRLGRTDRTPRFA